MRRARGEAERCPSLLADVSATLATGCATFADTGAVAAGCDCTCCALSPIIPITSPTATSSPSFFTIFCSTPLCSALTSTLTLSVSSSTSASPTLTASPSCLSQVAITASTMDSPNAGTRISTDIYYLPFTHQNVYHSL